MKHLIYRLAALCGVIDKETALRRAAWGGRSHSVRAWLAAGADVHTAQDQPLRWAAARGHTETVRVLLAAGADVHADEDEALRMAAWNGHADIVADLLAAGADIHAGEDWALRWAARNGHKQTIAVLNDWIAAKSRKPVAGGEVGDGDKGPGVKKGV